MYSLAISISGLPPMTNSMNYKHWTVKKKIKDHWKGLVHNASISNGVPEKPLVEAKLSLTRFSSGRCDFDGLVSSFKHCIDGLVSAGVLIDDNYQVIGQPEYKHIKCKKSEGHILIEVIQI